MAIWIIKRIQNFEEAKTSIHSNYIGLVSILAIIANDLEKLSGTIVGISSVAGDREGLQIIFMAVLKQHILISQWVKV